MAYVTVVRARVQGVQVRLIAPIATLGTFLIRDLAILCVQMEHIKIYTVQNQHAHLAIIHALAAMDPQSINNHIIDRDECTKCRSEEYLI